MKEKREKMHRHGEILIKKEGNKKTSKHETKKKVLLPHYLTLVLNEINL